MNKRWILLLLVVMNAAACDEPEAAKDDTPETQDITHVEFDLARVEFEVLGPIGGLTVVIEGSQVHYVDHDDSENQQSTGHLTPLAQDWLLSIASDAAREQWQEIGYKYDPRAVDGSLCTIRLFGDWGEMSHAYACDLDPQSGLEGLNYILTVIELDLYNCISSAIVVPNDECTVPAPSTPW